MSERYDRDCTLAMQISCVKREIALRKNVYPKWVASGRMKLDMAEREIDCMTAVLRSLETLAVASGS
jgi:hypothetical protein